MKRRDAEPEAKEGMLGARVEDALAAALRPVRLAPDQDARLRARVLARITTDPGPAPRELVTVRASEGEWTTVGSRIERKVLFEDPATRTRSVLIRLRPGARIEPHPHGIHEECVVLEGELRIGALRLHAGDYHVAPAGVPHGLVESEQGALIFLREEMRD
jgi:quercetin dioxygenase-like cupin family protein